MENYFNQSADDTAKALGVDVVVGITEAEAQERSAKYGKNRLEGGKEKSILQMALEQLKDFLVIILIIAAVISVILGETIRKPWKSVGYCMSCSMWCDFPSWFTSWYGIFRYFHAFRITCSCCYSRRSYGSCYRSVGYGYAEDGKM